MNQSSQNSILGVPVKWLTRAILLTLTSRQQCHWARARPVDRTSAIRGASRAPLPLADQLSARFFFASVQRRALAFSTSSRGKDVFGGTPNTAAGRPRSQELLSLIDSIDCWCTACCIAFLPGRLPAAGTLRELSQSCCKILNLTGDLTNASATFTLTANRASGEFTRRHARFAVRTNRAHGHRA